MCNDDIKSETPAQPTRVRLPNNATMQSNQIGHLQLPLSPSATETNLFSTINHNLTSIGQLCDDGCEATFTKTKVTVTKNGKTIIQGSRDKSTKLWILPTKLEGIPEERAYNVYETTNATERVQYLHAAAGYPVPSTWVKAIKKGFYATWPGLTATAVIKNLPKSPQTTKGHQHTKRQNVRSTKPKPTRDHFVYAATVDAEHLIATDLTGKFPVTSSKGNKYILILWDSDSNAILAEPMQNRTAAEHVRAYEVLHTFLSQRGCRPQLQRLDNEASEALKTKISEKDMEYQLVPPHNHRTNPCERAIQTFKNHFIATLAGTDPHFPLHLWDRTLPQVQMTLNMLRASNINPNILAYAQLNGQFDFNATPLAPIGTKVIVHERPAQRGTWAVHGQDGWYIGPAMEHYRCYKTYITTTRGERNADTVEFFPAHAKVPYLSSSDNAITAAKQLVEALRNPMPRAPFETLGTRDMQALEQLAEIFNAATRTRKPVIDMQKVTELMEPETVATTEASPPRVVQRDAPSPRVLPPAVTPPRVPPLQKQQSASIPTQKPMQTTKELQTEQIYKAATKVLTRAALRRVIRMLEQNRKTLAAREQQRQVYQQQEHLAFAIYDEETGKLLEYRHLHQHPKYREVWNKSFANEIGRLAQGIRDIKGTDTIKFIRKSQVPAGRTVTYGRIVCKLRPMKKEVERTRLTVGGNLIEYPDNLRTETADLQTIKILINSVISTPGARFMALDVKNFYLNTPMSRYEYMRLPLKIIPEEIVEHYNLKAIAVDGWVYMEIQKGMYGLPQAGKIANDLLKERLDKHGYYPSKLTPGLWHHKTRPTKFTLIVDDFGAKITNNQDAAHLIATLRKYYEVSVDKEGKLYAGITLKWDYDNKEVELSMPKYITKARTKFNHPPPSKQYDAPSKYTAPTFGKDSNKLAETTPSKSLSKEETKTIQQTVGTLQYYGRGVDPTILHALNDIAATQTNATDKTAEAVLHLLNYLATHPDATIRYVASPMILHVHSDASYLTASKARSRAGGNYFLSGPDKENTTINGPIHSLAKIIKNVMASAAEAELGALYMNAQDTIPIRNTLEELGHPQPAAGTPIRTDNSTANGIVHGSCKPQKTKSMDMRFHWLKDRRAQEQLDIYWAPGKVNTGDYYTKHHPTKYHRALRPYMLNTARMILNDRTLQGCVETLASTRDTQSRIPSDSPDDGGHLSNDHHQRITRSNSS